MDVVPERPEVVKAGLLSIADTDIVTFGELPGLAGRPGSITALLDAARLPGLPARIKASGAAALSLFDGSKAAPKRHDVAPYLVSLNGELSQLQALLGGPDDLTAKPRVLHGILLLSSLGLNPLRRHFRRFLHAEAEGRPCLFRFWDPPAAIAYFDAIARAEDRWHWFSPREGGLIDAILVPDGVPDRLRAYRAGPIPAGPARPIRPFRLGTDELAALKATRSQVGEDQLVAQMNAAFPQLVTQIGAEDFDRIVRKTALRCAGFGISQHAHLFRIAAWDLHARGRFEDVDPGHELARILAADLNEVEKMRRLAARIATLAPANSQLPID